MSNPDRKLIDLPPTEWEPSDKRAKSHEPFFGMGAPEWLAYIVGLTFTLTITHWLTR